jgi:hypothetical protein
MKEQLLIPSWALYKSSHDPNNIFMSVGNGFGCSKRGGAQQLPPPLPHFFCQLNQKNSITPMIQVFL